MGPLSNVAPSVATMHGFEYKRNGTLSLYAALNTKTGRHFVEFPYAQSYSGGIPGWPLGPGPITVGPLSNVAPSVATMNGSYRPGPPLAGCLPSRGAGWATAVGYGP